MLYDKLPDHFQGYVAALLEHAETALWPERRAALESFYQGIENCSEADLTAATNALGLVAPSGEQPAMTLYRVMLTAYLERLGEAEITNPDQAWLYSLSFSRDHAALAESWYAEHPEHRLEE
ncbi:MAG: hypothetical protein MI920_16640 [Kiloniellales bacterium]|nr:hypothetical protein [Kiloniellales bacterium]